MSKVQLTQSLRDILPTFSGDYPPQLVAYIDSLYQLSLQNFPVLPNKADVARYHLCAYLAVQRCQSRYALPEPLVQRIPLQPKYVNKLLADIEEKVVSAASPPTTPRKRKMASLPAKHAPGVGLPLKKLQKADFDTSPTELRDQASPFNIKSSPAKPVTPRKPKLSAPATPSSPRYIRHLTLADFVSFANNFYIPAGVTPHIVETFMAEKYKFAKKNEWLLACGLVHAAYVRINHKLLNSTIGKKSELQDQLFQYQKGGLMKANMVMWLNIVEEAVKSEPWIVDLELKYVHNVWSAEDTSKEREIVAKLGRGYDLLLAFGDMECPSVMFDKPSQAEYYATWTARVREKLR